LWNHEVTIATFIPYDSPNMNVPTGQPSSVSLLCLSCHDGTVALDAYGGGPGGDEFVPDYALTGTDISDDHPISIDWQHQTLRPGSNLLCPNCHFDPGPVPFFEGKVECSSCHDPHNMVTETKMLRMSRAGSELCLHCHQK
jgi:predicted CXXCH cytochrome family protein